MSCLTGNWEFILSIVLLFRKALTLVGVHQLASAVPMTVYTGTDLAPSGLAYSHYTNFDDPGATHEPHQPWSTHSGWKDQATYQQGESSTSTGWGTFPT